MGLGVKKFRGIRSSVVETGLLPSEQEFIAGSLLSRAQVEQEVIQRKDLLLVALFGILSLVVRLPVLLATNFGIESDEAIVGLMAKHILSGTRPWPIFYYGQPYMGSFEPFIVALGFKVFGQWKEVLKLVPLSFSLVHIALTYILALRIGNRRAAVVAALLTAICPSALAVWSSKARGGFIELVVLGSLALLLASEIFSKHERPKFSRLFALSFVLGVAWWVNNQAIFYLASIGSVVLWKHVSERDFKGFLRYIVFSLPGFFIGSSLFWVYNFTSQPSFKTFRLLAQPSEADTLWPHVRGFFSTALPILTGARGLWQNTDLFIGATFLTLSLVAALLGVSFFQKRDTHSFEMHPFSFWGMRLLWCFLLLTPTIFCFSAFGWLAAEPRYLLPMYSVLYVLVAIGIDTLLANAVAREGGTACLLVLLAIHLWSNFPSGEIATPGEPFVESGERVSRDHRELYRWLLNREYHHVNTSYWIGYRTAFETNEAVTFSLIGRDAVVRIPEYETQRSKSGVTDPFVLVPSQARSLGLQLRNQGFQFEETPVQGYVIFDKIKPVATALNPIPLSLSQISVPSRVEWEPSMIDGDSKSRWGTGMPQAPGMTVSVELPQPKIIAGVDLDLGDWTQDSPRGLRIEGDAGPNSQNIVLFTSPVASRIDSLGPLLRFNGSTVVMFRFDVNTPLKRIRLVQTGSDPVFDWSIAELRVYGH